MKSYRIPEIAKKYVEYDMIKAYTELPAFPDARARLLLAMLTDGKVPQPLGELYALVVSLVQMGLDTHDMIDDGGSAQPEAVMRARQLKVLAGDYFSSRFYHLLSQAGQIDMIGKIGAAVCEVNRIKMNLYLKMKQLKVTADEYIGFCTEVRSGLFHVFGGLLEERISRVWPELLSGFSRCEVVLHEFERASMPGRFDGSWAYWHIMQEGTEDERALLSSLPEQEEGVIRSLIAKYNVRGLLADMLKHSAGQVQAAIRRLESDRLASELLGIGERFLRPLAAQRAVYNEMR